jgi:hypothetical protein
MRPEAIMAKSERTTEDYEDRRTRLAKQPYNVLIGWAVVCCIALGALVEFWRPALLSFGPESTVREAVKHAPIGNPSFEADEPTLADDIGMIAKPKE